MLRWTGIFFVSCLASHAVLGAGPRAIDRSQWPAALRDVPLERLSSGALLLLDSGGDLVQPPANLQTRAETGSVSESAAVTLDLRVGANIRLGDDPAVLPSAMRAQAEPHIARSQVDPDFIVGVFQEGRFTDGGAVDCGYAVSHNGGLTWTHALISGLTRPVGGPYYRATDPVAGIDLNGRIYLNTDNATSSTGFTTGVVTVSRSIDGGVTFEPPVIVYDPGTSGAFPDKNWMAINNFAGTSTAGRIIVTFTLFTNINSNGAPILRVFSDDAGKSWSPPDFVSPPTSPSQGSQPVFLPDGRLAVVSWNFGSITSLGERLEVVVSNDGGGTFGPPQRIANAIEYRDPSIRSGSFLPSATADRTNPNLYVVYQALFAGAPRILFTKSTDAGATWTAPIPITDNLSNTGVFNPAIGASPDGNTLTVTFYDHRANPGSPTLVDLFLAQSFDGGATWEPNIRVSSVSTDASLAPRTDSGYMLGDYLGIAEATNTNVPAVPIWVDTRTGNADPFVARIGIAPQVDFISWQAARLSSVQINDPASGGQSGDADRDGEDNLSEFKANTDPNDAASVFHSARQLNLSARLRVETGDNAMIGGFIINGPEQKKIILRAIGPSLVAVGIPNALQDPTLELHDQTEALIAFNDNWRDAQASDIEATGIPPRDERESAMVQTLAPGRYTAIVRGKNDSTGVGLIELYDLGQTSPSQLANMSTRGFVETDTSVMIGGFIVGAGLGTSGSGSARVVARAIGPSLAASGVTNPLLDPTMELHDRDGAAIISNDNWKEVQQADIQATGLAPADDRAAALIVTLASGNYTAVVRGKGNTAGVALVEIYNVP